MASTTKSASPTSPTSVDPVMHAFMAARASGLILPRDADRSQLAVRVAMPRSSTSGLRSTRVVRTPFSAMHMAIPPPIVPAPITATESTARGATPAIDDGAAAASAAAPRRANSASLLSAAATDAGSVLRDRSEAEARRARAGPSIVQGVRIELVRGL